MGLPSGPLRISMGSLWFSFHEASVDLSLDLRANFGINYDDGNKWRHICITNVSTKQGQLLGIRHWWSCNPSCVTLAWLPQSLRLTSALCERRRIIWGQAQRWPLEVALFFLFEQHNRKWFLQTGSMNKKQSSKAKCKINIMPLVSLSPCMQTCD